MVGTLRAEVLKLRKRPAVWVCVGILVVLVLLLGYLVTYLVYSRPPASGGQQLPRGITYADLKVSLYPLHFIQNTLSGAAQLGGVIAMIIGVLAQGSEYGWATVKTAFTQKPRRVEVVGTRLAVVALICLLNTVLVLGLAAATSFLLASVDGKATDFPATETIVKGVLALWLIQTFWAWFGFALATLFRQSALAIGLGLAYALVIELLIFGVAGSFGGDTVKAIHQWFPLANVGYLVQSFGSASRLGEAALTRPYADGTHGAVLLVLYCAAFAAASLGLSARRDVE